MAMKKLPLGIENFEEIRTVKEEVPDTIKFL